MSKSSGKHPHLRRRLIAVVAAATSLAGTGAAVASAAPEDTRSQDPASPAAMNPLGDLPDRLDALGSGAYAGIYGGVEAVDNATRLVVHLTTPSPAAQQTFRALGPTGSISFVATSHSLAALQAIHARVTRAAADLAADGIHLVEWGPHIQTGYENIQVLNLTDADRSELEERFGAGNITVTSISEDELPGTDGRGNDTSPYNGGDAITNYTEGCSSAFGVTMSGTTYLMTAAHCFVPGDNIYNDWWPNPSGSGNLMGTERSRDISYAGTDTALLNMRGSDLLWTGDIGDAQRAVVSGVASNPIGYQVCNDGAYTGYVCGLEIKDNGLCISIGPYAGLSGTRYECNIVKARKLNQLAEQSGNSGGPVVRFNGALMLGAGVVSGHFGNAVTCTHTSHNSNCYDGLYYTGMQAALNTWNATLNTG